MSRTLALIAVAAVAIAAAPATELGTLIATEKAFSNAAADIGIARAFRKYAAPGAIVLQDKPVPVEQAYPDAGKGTGELVWRPVAAGVAASGELGFDLGPWTLGDGKGGQSHGWFATVWGVQPDRHWRFLVDGGIASGNGPSPVPESEVAAIRPGVASSKKATLSAAPGQQFAFVDVQNEEVLVSSRGMGISRMLADNAWVLRSGQEAAQGKAAAALARKDPRLNYRTLGGGISGAGDLAYFYGSATNPKVSAHYLRVWSHQPDGWRIVLDSLVPSKS